MLKGAVLSAFGIFWIILPDRIVGLRSFSKITSFDFVMTVAMGSLLAGASRSQEWTEFVQTLSAMASLFAVQYCISKLRFQSRRLDDWFKKHQSC